MRIFHGRQRLDLMPTKCLFVQAGWPVAPNRRCERPHSLAGICPACAGVCTRVKKPCSQHGRQRQTPRRRAAWRVPRWRPPPAPTKRSFPRRHGKTQTRNRRTEAGGVSRQAKVAATGDFHARAHAVALDAARRWAHRNPAWPASRPTPLAHGSGSSWAASSKRKDWGTRQCRPRHRNGPRSPCRTTQRTLACLPARRSNTAFNSAHMLRDMALNLPVWVKVSRPDPGGAESVLLDCNTTPAMVAPQSSLAPEALTTVPPSV